MRKLILLFLLVASSAWAQNPTNVSGTIVDPSAIPYYPAQVTACLSPVTTDPLVGGKHVNPNIGTNYCIGPVSTASTGAFTMGLHANGNITPAATTWIFTVTAIGSAPPAGTGSQTFQSSGITISGTSQDVGATLSALAPKLTAGAGGVSGSQAIYLNSAKYNLFMDWQFCWGAAVGVTNLSSTVTCSTASFTSADIGKAIFATSGAGGVGNNIAGQVILPEGTITSINSGTSVQVSTTGNNLAVATALAWGHYDDTGISLAEADGAALNGCPTYVLPNRWIGVKLLHFNLASMNSTTCGGNVLPTAGLGATSDYQSKVIGPGPGAGGLVFTPSFPFASCTNTSGSYTNVCYFAVAQMVLENFGIIGLGNAATGNHTATLACPGPGSQVSDVSFSGFGGNDSGALVGLCFQATRGKFVSIDGFGSTPLNVVDVFGIPSMCYFCFAGDSRSTTLTVAANAKLIDVSGQYGLQTSNAVISVSGTLVAMGTYLYGKAGATDAPGVSVNNGGKLIANPGLFNADFTGCGPTFCDGVDVLSGGKAFIYPGSILGGRGGSSFSLKVASGGTAYDYGSTLVTNSGGLVSNAGTYVPVGGGPMANNTTSASTNFGANLTAQTLVATTPVKANLNVRIGARQVTAGVGCGAGSNTVFATLAWTAPGGNAQTQVTTTLTISANGALDSGANAYQTFAIPTSSGTSVTYTTTSVLASAGCGTTPQYAVDATVL